MNDEDARMDVDEDDAKEGSNTNTHPYNPSRMDDGLKDDDDLIQWSSSSSSSSSSSRTILGSRMVIVVDKTQQHQQQQHEQRHRLRGNIFVSIHHPSQTLVLTFLLCEHERGEGRIDGSSQSQSQSLSSGLYRGSIPLHVFKQFLPDDDGYTNGDGTMKVTKDDTAIHHILRKILIEQLPDHEQQQVSSATTTMTKDGVMDDGGGGGDDEISGLHLSIQFKNNNPTTGILHADDTMPETCFVLVLGNTLEKGMVQKLFERNMERLPTLLGQGSDSVVTFCTMTGHALNGALQKIRELQETIDMWRSNTKRLDSQRQDDRDRLLTNFNILRLDAIQRHKKEIDDLKKKHDEEILTIKSTMPTVETAAHKRRRNMLTIDNIPTTKVKDEQDKIDDDNIRLPFNDAEGLLLKEGKSTSTTRRQAARKRVLEATDATDMNALYKSADDFEQQKVKQRTTKSKPSTTKKADTKKKAAGGGSRRQKSSLSSSSSDSETDVEGVAAAVDTSGSGASGSLTRKKEKHYESSSSSSSRKDGRTKSKTATNRNERSYVGYEDSDDTDDDGGGNNQVPDEKPKTKAIKGKTRKQTVGKSTKEIDVSEKSDANSVLNAKEKTENDDDRRSKKSVEGSSDKSSLVETHHQDDIEDKEKSAADKREERGKKRKDDDGSDSDSSLDLTWD